ncbi:type II toxin-antitoxin system death-on-curing family toxin [Halobacteriales archaeon QS_9_68_42]|nr:MAG: type II toxin-antitoxin system death-on-curing family toxin [Halobacteriales archaeon QS_9_68_42]
MTDDLAYPSVELILNLHEQIVAEGDATEPGVRSENAMRLLVAEHPFVDGNKRTALRTVVVFYMLNGYTFDYGDEIRALLHHFATDEAAVDTDTAVIYFRACARRN